MDWCLFIADVVEFGLSLNVTVLPPALEEEEEDDADAEAAAAAAAAAAPWLCAYERCLLTTAACGDGEAVATWAALALLARCSGDGGGDCCC